MANRRNDLSVEAECHYRTNGHGLNLRCSAVNLLYFWEVCASALLGVKCEGREDEAKTRYEQRCVPRWSREGIGAAHRVSHYSSRPFISASDYFSVVFSMQLHRKQVAGSFVRYGGPLADLRRDVCSHFSAGGGPMDKMAWVLSFLADPLDSWTKMGGSVASVFELLRVRCSGVPRTTEEAVWQVPPHCRWWTAVAQCGLGLFHVCSCSRTAPYNGDPILSEVPRDRPHLVYFPLFLRRAKKLRFSVVFAQRK